MSAHLGHQSVVNDHYVVGVLDGRQAVGDHYARPTLLCPLQGFLDHLGGREREQLLVPNLFLAPRCRFQNKHIQS